jgi:hypothetical protein
MKYTVTQFQVEPQLDTFGNFKDASVENLYLDGMMYGKIHPATFLKHHEVVCEIEADDLDEVFEIGNLGYSTRDEFSETKGIRRLRKMTSVSVGNVIRDDKGQCFVVKGCGFEKLGEVA